MPEGPKTQGEKRRATHSVDLGMMRAVNRAIVLDMIKSDGPLSRAAIAKATELTKPTVSIIVDQLISDGLVTEAGPSRTSPGAGRPPVLLEFNAQSQYAVGLHIGVEKTVVSLADAAGREISRQQRLTPKGEPLGVLTEIAGVVDRVLETDGINRQRVAALGVSVSGLVDPHTGVCLLAPNLGWRDVPVLDILQNELGIQTFVHNALQAAVVAENLEGAGRKSGDLVLLYTGLGVGAGVLRNGRIFHGATGLAGEIGHCVIPGATGRCACGKIGCLETVASAPAVARLARLSIAEGRQSQLAPLGDQITSVDVALAAEAGDDLAAEVLARAGEALGIAGSWLVNLFDPAVVVVGGGLVGAGEPLLAPLRQAVNQHSLPQAAKHVAVRTWALGSDSKVRGAVLLALQNSDSYYRLVFGA